MIALAHVAPTPVDEVPFRIGEDAIIVDTTVNDRKVSLMYDTGFSGAVILSDNIDVGKPTGTMTMTDFVGSFQAKTIAIKSLKIGDKPFDKSDLEVVQQPTEHYTAAYGTHCDGILGFEPFGGKVYQINFEHRKFVFYPDTYDVTTLKPDGVKTFLTKLLPKGINSLQMSAEVSNGQKLYLALDTGNSGYIVTHKDALERVKAWPEGKTADFMGQSMVASGAVNTFNLEMHDMKIFGVPVPKCVVGVIDLPSSQADHDGTVGYEFLHNFNITVDMIRRRVYFENWTGKVVEPESADVGVLAFDDPRVHRMRIVSVTPGSPAEKAGIKRGDELLSVDGQEVAGIGFRRLTALLHGQLGTKVKLDVSREGSLMRYELERAYLVNRP